MNTPVSALARTASQSPSQVAYRFTNKELTYSELNNQAHSLANYLVNDLGVAHGDRVGIYLHKGLAQPLAVFAILRAGGVYVPLDAAAPVERIGRILNSCTPRVVITQAPLVQDIPNEYPVVVVDSEQWLSALEMQPFDGPWPAQEDSAYIIFSSGSTGEPKGIEHTHQSAAAFAEMMIDHYKFTSMDRFAGISPLHFDMSTLDLFAATRIGATTVLVSEAHQKAPASLTKLVEVEQLTVWYSTPICLILALESGGMESRNWKTLRWVIYAGESYPVEKLNALMLVLSQAQFSNAYGPAETNVTHIFDLPKGRWPHDSVPIGHACIGVTEIIEDSEIYLSAPTLMRGYWRAPELNSCQMHDCDGRTFYRTGDLVRTDPQGILHFAGRADRQVKFRGHRIELDEIEFWLQQLDEVDQASVVVCDTADDERTINADVTLMEGCEASKVSIRSSLAKKLPRYSIPIDIRIHKFLPRTSSGKINRLKLESAWLHRTKDVNND